MADRARSENAAVQRQLDRLDRLSPGRDILGLERIQQLLARLGNPEHSLPPVFHVAGTNGKGSVCAFLRAGIEAAGLTAHVYTSPHLVRFNERIRVAGSLIEDELLAALLEEVLDQGDDIGASFFEVTTAAAFLAFSRVEADATILEVGLGGRLDATNVIERPLVCGIASLGIDHQVFLGDDAAGIAAEKAGIAKAGAPLVTQKYAPEIMDRIERETEMRGGQWIARGTDWDGAAYRGTLHYRDHEAKLRLPLPRLPGAHQADNALLAVAMLRHQQRLDIPEAALKAAMGWADWPARLQTLELGPLRDILGEDTQILLDGGHNPLAAEAIAEHVADFGELHLVIGLLANKDAQGFLDPLLKLAQSATFVPIDDHECHSPEALAKLAQNRGTTATTANNVADALRGLATEAVDPKSPSTVLIGGSLYLAGDVLKANLQYPE